MESGGFRWPKRELSRLFRPGPASALLELGVQVLDGVLIEADFGAILLEAPLLVTAAGLYDLKDPTNVIFLLIFFFPKASN